MEISKEDYQNAIPSCCSLQTADEHAEELMLCWGLLDAIKKGEPMNCYGCELRRPVGDWIQHEVNKDA